MIYWRAKGVTGAPGANPMIYTPEFTDMTGWKISFFKWCMFCCHVSLSGGHLLWDARFHKRYNRKIHISSTPWKHPCSLIWNGENPAPGKGVSELGKRHDFRFHVSSPNFGGVLKILSRKTHCLPQSLIFCIGLLDVFGVVFVWPLKKTVEVWPPVWFRSWSRSRSRSGHVLFLTNLQVYLKFSVEAMVEYFMEHI